MSFSRSSLRYAHTNGYTGLLYTTEGEFIITCGSDGDIRRWTSISDDDPSSTCLGEFVMCMANAGKRLLASTDRNTVQAYTFPDMDNDGIIMRFTAPATCMRVCGPYTAAGSEDTEIKVLNSNCEMALKGHTGPILSLDILSKQHLLASVGGDGQLKVWNIETRKELINISGLPRVNCFENASLFGTPCFEPKRGEQLAYALDKEIVVINSSNWEVAYKLQDEHVASNYSCCQFSPSGARLAAGTTSGELSVFDVKKRKALKVEAPTSDCNAITCLVWNPAKEGELAFCDASGQLGTLFLDDSDVTPGLANIELSGELEEKVTDENDIDDTDNVSLDQLKQKVMRSAIYTDQDDAVSFDHDEEDSKHSLASSNVASSEQIKKHFKQQKAFQPGSTPNNMEHHYLCWNEVGIVTSHTEPNGDSTIDVEFHDASVHHALHINNYNQHTLASLSCSALALASTASSKLVVVALATTGNKEWSANLPDCEFVESVAATSQMVAVATSMHFLRLFTIMGTQREVLSIPGPVVALTGHGYSLLSIYHGCGPSQSQQHLAAMLIRTRGWNIRVENLTLPLTPGRMLTWVGFSDIGSPAFADNMGLVQLFIHSSNVWFPICDTMKQSSSVSHNYFIISISEFSQIVQAVLCRGTSYPMTNPRSMLHELRMQLPLCDIDLQKSEHEDILMRASIMGMNDSEKQQKEASLKLFALACRNESEMRAKELIETIACPELLHLAIKYATKLGRIHLSDCLVELVPKIEALQEARKQQQQLQLHNVTVPVNPTTEQVSSLNKLAPKAIELSACKQGTLKRFSNSTNLFKTMVRPSTPEASQLHTQENIFGESESQQSTNIALDHRSPLNSVNPFSTKRKLADTGVIFSSEKLKLVKK